MIDLIPPQHRTSTVAALLRTIEESGDWSLFPLLRDALADAGGVPPVDLLYARVLALPEHDEARLDWADAVGGERGEFVKVQIAIPELQSCMDANEPRRSKDGSEIRAMSTEMIRLLDRERELLLNMDDKATANWVRWLPQVLRGNCICSNIASPREDYPQTPRIMFARGFIDSITCSWSDFLRHHETLIWSPAQRVACPRDCVQGFSGYVERVGETEWRDIPCAGCDGTGLIRRPFATTVACPECMETGISGTMGRKREPVDCENCGATGRITVSLARTAQPMEVVRIVDSHQELVPQNMMGDHGMLGGYRFDRVKCPTCGNIGDERMAGGSQRHCPTCRGIPLNLWQCEAWPGVTFEMPCD